MNVRLFHCSTAALLCCVTACGVSYNPPTPSAGSAFSYSGTVVGLAGKCLDSAGTAAQIHACNGSASQTWTFLDGQLHGPAGRCLDAEGGSSANGTRVLLWDCNQGDNQRWSLDGQGQITGIGGKCLDVSGANASDGTPVILWDCSGAPNQKWALGTSGSAPTASGGPNSPYVPAGYDLVFGDEFNAGTLDTSKWWTRYVYSSGTLDFLNDETERFREKNNHLMTGSALDLTAYAPGDARSEDLGPGLYSSGIIRSKTLVKYGYFEARVKMPRGLGVWPAFWLTSETQSWPPEIDIFEFLNNGQDDKVNMLHTGVIAHAAQQSTFVYSDPSFNTQWTYWTAPYDFPDDYHVIAGLWDADGVTTFVDGKKIVQRGYLWVKDDGSDAGYAHVLLNLAIGGNWAGRYGVDDSAFPQALEIDYVRVYQKSGAHDTSVSTTGSDLCPASGGC